MTAGGETAPASWRMADALVLVKAVNAVLDQAIAAGVQPDWATYNALLAMQGRLLPPTGQAAMPPDELDALYQRARVADSTPLHDVLAYRVLLRDELACLLQRLDHASTARPGTSTTDLLSAVEHIDLSAQHVGLFSRQLRRAVHAAMREQPDGGVH